MAALRIGFLPGRSASMSSRHGSGVICGAALSSALSLQARALNHLGYEALQTRHASFQVFRDVRPLQLQRRDLYRPGYSVGFVPTMGALHEGHLNLIRNALRENTHVFVSIFVNPTQFGVNEDLDAYPKTWKEDMEKLELVERELSSSSTGRIAGIFAPTVKTMYPTLPPSSEPAGDGSFVTIMPLGKWLEGASRPVFFRGVATVCTKLFNIVQPDLVYFGQKDVQQSVLIKRLVKDFHFSIQVRVIPTSRESDGLAMSSRNVYLGQRRRRDVVVLSQALFAAQAAYNAGETSARSIRQAALDVFKNALKLRDGRMFASGEIEIDYIALSQAEDMETISDDWHIDPQKGAILSAAMRVLPVEQVESEEEEDQGLVRLIDNVILEPRDI
jgi:pantoate--beta-alanine ligase